MDKKFTKDTPFKEEVKKEAKPTGTLKASHEDESDYSQDDFSLEQEGIAKEKRKEIQNKQLLKQHQQKRAAGMSSYADDEGEEGKKGADPKLDALWTRIRDFMNDVGGSDIRRDHNANATKLKLQNQFETYDPSNKGSISKTDLKAAFVAARLFPIPSESEWNLLITSLDAWDRRDDQTVLYRNFLRAPYQRETISMYGIFPKVQQRGLTQYELERKAKAEEEERKKQEALEEDLKKKSSGSKLGEKGRSLKDEQVKRDAEKRDAERIQKLEEEAIQKEARQVMSVVHSCQMKILQKEGNIRKWFTLFDSNKDAALDQKELQSVLVHAGARLGTNELNIVFRLLDQKKQGKIPYGYFCDVIESKTTPGYIAFVREERNKRRQDQADQKIDPMNTQHFITKSKGAEVGSSQVGRTEKLGPVDDMDSIMGGSQQRQRDVPQLMNDEADFMRVQNEIKELLRSNQSGKPTSFEDLLHLMGQPKFQKEGQVRLIDFKTVVNAVGGKDKFSAHEVKLVFNEHSIDPPKHGAQSSLENPEAYIPIRVFKDVFLPSIGWKRDDILVDQASAKGHQSAASESASKTESLAIDYIMGGKKPEEPKKEPVSMIREEQKQTKRGSMDQISENMNEQMSIDSRISKPIEEIVESRKQDPRKKNVLRQLEAESALNQENLKKLEAKTRVNDQLYRQPETVIKEGSRAFEFDRSLDRFFRNFCSSLVEEANSGPVKREIESYIDHYGKESPGFLLYSEFKEIFITHVQSLEKKQPQPEEGKLLALYNLFDVQSRGKVAKADFIATIERVKPAISLLERLSNKIKKGGDRFIRALKEEFQEADAPFGCNGQLPLNNFQVILADYDLPLVQLDIDALEKRGYITKDEMDYQYVNYPEILKVIQPKMMAFSKQTSLTMRAVVRIQTAWRAFKARRIVNIKKMQRDADLGEVTDVIEALRGDPKKSRVEGKGKDLEKRKRDAAIAKDRQKDLENIETKMAGVIRPGKESKYNEKLILARKDMSEYIKKTVMEHIVEAAFCYGESLGTCRTIQKRFETRPVTKYLFPMLQEFQYGIQGVLPKSLQTVNQIGQILCLDSENQLNQYDIATTKSLQSVNLGTRPPLKHYPIIDMVCDQASGRIYTLNANWILEIWSIQQSASFPEKRLAVCANEGGKDFIHLYYQQTFNNSKPRFLSLQESNQQILVVNTSCVDGSIVFIDPISFSVLKKIQLRYSDYEIPKVVRDSIKHLQSVFDKIRENQGKDVAHIFSNITDQETHEVKIRDFVSKLTRLDPTLSEDELFKCCRTLDNDGSGTITLDEFLEFFGDLHRAEADQKNAEEELEDEMWPEWLVKEGKLAHVQSLLVGMHCILEQEHGITAEQAFGIYDLKDTGEAKVEEFRRVLRIFFGEAMKQEGDLDLLMRLTHRRGNQMIDYREFCKFLSKRVVRGFKNHTGSTEGGLDNEDKGKSMLQNELDRPLQKEATLTYILRKAAELKLDFRAILIEHDKNELNVIPRSKFVGLLLGLPLGITEAEVQEILENDLHFDNYGNVDYTVILNSDLFCHLERLRLKATHKKKGVKMSVGDEPSSKEQSKSDADKVDNRKVVVEDLIYIDDLEVLIYTTIAPQTSTIFITSVKKSNVQQAQKSDVEVVTLKSLAKQDAKKEDEQPEKQNLLTNYYQLLAKLKGHSNQDPPSICYVPHSCCLISGEKRLNENEYQPPKDSFPSSSDPSVPASHKFQKSKQSAYEKHAARNTGNPCEILIWNLQRDLIELFQSRPPWNVPFHQRVKAHNSSIVDLCYLKKSQLIVSASTDQTIKFFDPITTSYELTDPSNNPHAMMRPGHYRPLLKEKTKSNYTFKEVKRIYTGSDTSCFALRTLKIANIQADSRNPELKSQIEWLIALKLGKPQWQQNRNTQVGFICGYGIERVKIEVPALHLDDIVPPFVLKECEEMVTARRRKLISNFQVTLQQSITKIFSQVQLQDSYISKIRALFMQAILQRKELKYVNPEPLREIYKLILKLPDRTKFQSFLASSGCRDKLSVSETFFYLQKFQQIHPLRTTQIEFERSIQEFHDKHQRQFLKGIKRWPKQSVQRFADHIRRFGLDTAFLQINNGANGKHFTSFCTRERFTQYFQDVVNSKGDYFSDLEIDSILNDLDPFYTGVIQLRLLQKVYKEEIQFFKRTSLSRPNEILDDIRTLIFPNKRVALQQALASADQEGDGFLKLPQFISAFQAANVPLGRDTLEFLFNVMSETFTLPKTEYEPNSEIAPFEKVISLDFFMTKLFKSNETREVDEVEQTLSHIKAALIYKGLDFSIIFAEQSEENVKKQKRQAQKKSKEEKVQAEQMKQQAKKKREQNVDMTMHYTRFAQQIVKDEFCRRIDSLNAQHVTHEKIHRLATFLALNQKNETIIYLNSWLHHLRRANTAFQEADRRVLPLICSKLLKNERVFRSWLESCGHIRGKREEEKFIQLADLRQVLTKFGVSYVNQDMFLKEFSRGDTVHVEDLVTRVKSYARQFYQDSHNAGEELPEDEKEDEFEPYSISDLRKTDFFSKVHQEIKHTGIQIDTYDLLRQFRSFDGAKTGTIKAYLLINVLKHNYPEVFSEQCLLGLQFQLECLSGDCTVDYEEFTKFFLEETSKSKPTNEIKLDRKSPYNIQDYEDLLSKINSHVKDQGLDLMRIFEIFCKQGGFITFEDLGKILDLIEFGHSEHQFDLIRRYADENNQGTLHAYEFVNQILFSKEIAPSFDIYRWIVASRELNGRYQLLESIQLVIESIKDQLITRFGDSDGKHSGVLTATNFQDLVSTECPSLSESEKYLLCLYAIKGSKRIHGSEPHHSSRVDMKNDLVQFNHFEQALEEIIQHIRKEAIVKQEDLQDNRNQGENLQQFHRQIDQEMERQKRIDQEHFGSAQQQRMDELKRRIVGIFKERDITFFDCFVNIYDPLNSKASIIKISEFKKRIRQLNLPLTVQDHRLLRRIADPKQIGKVDIKKFCSFFETADLRQRRLNKILDKVSTAFFLQGFNMRRAFSLFDADGDGEISAKEFRQGMAALNLHLRYDEIDDLMHLCDRSGDGSVSYDEFISKMDSNIKRRTGQVMEKVEEAFFDKLGVSMEYNRESIFEIMKDYDFDQDGTIDIKDLPKVIKKLGIMNPEPHIGTILKAGGCGKSDKRIDYTDFSVNLEQEVQKRRKQSSSVYERQLQKISSILKVKDISFFEFFVMLDVNQTSSISRLEFKTGIQQLGLNPTVNEFESLWSSMHKPVIQMNTTSKRQKQRKNALEPVVEEVNYLSMIRAFAKAGCMKLQKALDHQDTLLSKFRSQLKKNRISVEKAYKTFDPNNYGRVQKKDFIHDCLTMGLQFSEEELVKLFEIVCAQGKKAEEEEQVVCTRFNYKQLQEAVLVQRDENWMYQACIKIHSVALQKGLSYKRLFTQWRDKQSKTTPGRLTEKELTQGLKRLKAGLTTDEIEKLCGSIHYEGKELSISAIDFEKFVIDGARKLESERSFQRMILQDWIVQFNDCIQREGAPIERIFYEYDSDQVGALTFEDFWRLNEQLGLCIQRKDLQRIFGILDRQRTKRVRMDDLKGVASLISGEDDQQQDQLLLQEEHDLKGLAGSELIRRQELNDIYEKVKETLENLNVTLEAIVFGELKYMPNLLLTCKGLQQVFERLDIILTNNEADRILGDIRKANNGKFEVSFKAFIDFMTRKRINVAFIDKGFIDPLIAQCCQNVSRAKDAFGLTFDQLFGIFDGSKQGDLTKENFLICAQGLQLEIAIEDLIELFNYMDEKNMNQISKVQFVDALTYVTNKLGGNNFVDAQVTRGLSTTKKGATNRQTILTILNNVADAIHKKQLLIRQVIQIFDINRTGFVSRSEFSQIVRGLCESITLDQSRLLLSFFDEKSTGKISVAEVVGFLQDLINQQIGGGVYAYMQVQPVIQKIINQLAIDADKFFDEVAFLNDQLLQQDQADLPADSQKRKTLSITIDQLCGLSKRLFFNKLAEYGVALSEMDKALMCQVFSLENFRDKLDYLKLDQAFEGEQQQLYALEEFYTVEWERRIFKKIGEYLKRHNMTIEACFDLIDDDGSQTVSMDELKQAIIRFDLRLNDKQIKVFLSRLSDKNATYISRDAFIKRFWSAFTYENIAEMDDQEQNSGNSMLPEGFNQAADRGRIATGLQQKLKSLRMLKAIQTKIRLTMTVSDAFNCLDQGIGFLVIRDFQVGLCEHFDLTLRQNEVSTLFLEVDSDSNGIVKFAEFDTFYNMDYEKRVQELEMEKERMVTQYDIFDHLLKVLKQKGLTLEEMFDQIDLDKNQFIEVDEFHQTLECMGFLITEEQVFELMRQMDDNFDGRISYKELRQHILRLGFSLDKTLESRNQEGMQKAATTFMWRDKGIETLIQALHNKLEGKSYEQFLGSFDTDHDGHLTPGEFRQSILFLKDGQLSRPQIERILHILLEEKKSLPLISIERMSSFLRSYKCLDEETGKAGSASLLIDEDLFVYIVERYDGFSRLVEQFNAVEERAQYISRHTHEINLRGLDMLANQLNLQKIHRRSKNVNQLYESTLILLAGEANRLIRDEAQLCVLDPSNSINTIVNDANMGALSAVSIPMIENSQFDVDYNTMETLPSGAQRYEGVMAKQRRRVEVLCYPNDYLNFVSTDGKVYKRHLQLELQVHRFLMGAHYEDEEELDPDQMDIFPNVGKFEKKIGLAASDKEIYVVNELIDKDEWINLAEFVDKNGGILNIPLFYHTDAPLFIIRHWAKMILKIIQRVHDVSAVLRCLNLGQIWVSRDGQRIKLGHARGVGQVNNFGYISTCPDIYLSLENENDDHRPGSSQSPTQKVGGAASSSKKTDGVRHFSNSCLDNPFIAPEILYLKFLDQSSALDVWSFGMIMFCLLLGKKPQSFYSVFRAWSKKCHGNDIEMATLPFTPPSHSNFLYDPFAIDFENPFEADDSMLIAGGLDIQGSLKEKKGSLNFENFIKCLKDMSYSSLFSQENSKKFHFHSIDEQINQAAGKNQNMQRPPRFSGQPVTNQETRLRAMQGFAKAGVLARKNELGLILDLISSCLDIDPKRRPTIPGLLHSPLFRLDSYEMTKAVRFSQNVILYRSPQSTVTMKITFPLRSICAHAMKFPERLIDIEEDILKMFAGAEECIAHISSLPLDEINDVLTEEEKRRALIDPEKSAMFKGRDYSRLRVSPNSPLAAQVIEDKVIDMLIFLTFRFTKAFNQWKNKMVSETESSQSPSKNHAGGTSQTELTRRSKSVRFGEEATARTSSQNQQAILKGQVKRVQNHILHRMTRMLKTLVYEMHSYSTPMSPFVKEVVEYVVKLYVGEEYELGSDSVLRRTAGGESNLKEYLKNRSFFRKDSDLDENFKSDVADKLWHLEQKNLNFLDKSNHWSLELHSEANKIFKDAITESGMGQSCYPVLNDYISNVSNSFDSTKIFSKQMNQLSLSYLIPMNRTTAYYNELIPITECLSRLYSPDLEKAGKRCALAMIRSVFQTGSSDKIKACLDMRIPKHIIHFLQDTDSEVKKECLLTLFEISKGLQDEDFEIMGKSAANLKQEFSKRGFRKTAFDQHKAISMASQSEAVEVQDQDVPMTEPGRSILGKKEKIPQGQVDTYSSYIKRTIALIEKNENERFINFALDLPNLNFLACKRFLKEMAVCFESPVFIAPLTRLLKTKSENFKNKEIILQVIENLFCGNERVLTALNSPATDCYMTLLRLLMQNTKTQNARANPSGLSAQMRNHLALQDKAVELFRFMFEQRRPTIIQDLLCIGASSTLLRDQGLKIPQLISLPDIVAFFDDCSQVGDDLRADMIVVKDFILVIKDLRCWVKHFYDKSTIPDLTKIKALQRCTSLLIKVVCLVWDDYKNVDVERRLESITLIKSCLQLFDWLCIQNKESFLFNEECGRANIHFVLDRCNIALSQFRAPQEQIQLPLEDLAFNTKKNKASQAQRKYDMFPFTEIGAILQNIMYQLVRKNSRYINQLLSEANFGFIFGEQLILEYDFIRHCIDNKIESMVLIDSYVKKNEIRLNTFEYLLRSSEKTLKDQFLASTFIDKLFEDYILDFKEFNIQFSKIDLEFLAFRRSYPIRLECISLVNTALMLKQKAPRVFTELVMYARRHFLIKSELDLLRRGRLSNKESTSLLLFAIILESNEEDLIHVMMQEGAPEVLRQLIRDHPSIGRKYPILSAFISPF